MNNLDFTQLLVKQASWSKVGPFSDTVFSTRIRLTRNIYGIPFPSKQKTRDLILLKEISDKFISKSCFGTLKLIDINSIDHEDKRFLRERNIITQNMETMDNCSAILSDKEDFVIMINDEDHFKIQVIKPGFQLSEAYSLADSVDNELNKFGAYAFAEEMGYITSDPSNGSIFVSTMLHLPVLSFTRRMTETQNIVKLSRLNIDGLKQEGIKTYGSIFILTNGFSIKISESEILDELEKITNKIINLESEARESYLAEHGIKLEDRICRSYGLLKFARRIGYVESMELLSDIRLGIILSVVRNIELQKINDLMVNMQWSHMQKIANKIFNDTTEGDIFRASYLRDQFEWSNIYG